jgi:hypothetical protein
MRAPSSTSELFAGEGMKYWWMSFCDPKRPKGDKFLGALIVTGEDHKAMLARSWLLELNPDGEVEFFEIPEQYHSRIPQGWVETRLITREEAEAFERKWSN